MSNNVEVHYDQLGQVAARLQARAEAGAELDRQLRACLEALERGGWIGLGADAFFGEMRGTIIPAMQRFTGALCEAQAVTLEIGELMRRAEEEAARLFQGGANTLAPGGGESGGGGGGGGGGGWGDIPPESGLSGKLRTTLYDLKKGGKEHPSELQLRYDLADGQLAELGRDGAGHWRVDAGAYKGGFGADFGFGKDKNALVGISGEFSGVKAEGEWLLLGDDQLGVAADSEMNAASADVLLGWNGERFGASAGVNLISVEGGISTNLAGMNVGVTGELGLKAEFGLEWGKEGVEVKFPLFSIGLSFGGAKDGKVD